MRIAYLRENETLFAVCQDQVYDGYLWEEMMFAEINFLLNSYVVRWEDDYKTCIHFDSMTDAKEYVKDNLSDHNPVSNGAKYKIDE